MTKHGQGAGTELKERSFASALTLGLQVSQKPTLARFSYFHVDMHCGPGWNQERDCPGSPAVFLNAAAAVGRTNYHAFFIDKNAAHIEELCRTVIAGNQRCYPMVGDNGSALSVVEQFILESGERAHFAIGSVVVDPNGYLDGVPIEALSAFAQRFPRIDLILNFNMRTKRLGEAHIKAGLGRWAEKRWIDLRDMPGSFHRRYGLIQERRMSGDPFVTMILRNFNTGSHAALGLVQLDCEMGRRIVERYGARDAARETVLNGSLF